MGGVYDPKTGKIEWTMHVPLEQQLAHYRSHPPAVLRELVATPIELDFTFDGHGEPVNAIFAVSCPCGSTLFEVYCHVDEDTTTSPIELACGNCEETYTLYDANGHGYDAVVGGRKAHAHGPDVYETDLEDPDVGAPHEVIVRFEFPSDHLGSGEHEGRESELFSWITILARDPHTKHVVFLFEDECA